MDSETRCPGVGSFGEMGSEYQTINFLPVPETDDKK